MDKEVTEEKRGIHWTCTTAKKNIDFADDVSFLSQIIQQEQTYKPNEEGDKLELIKTNQNKSIKTIAVLKYKSPIKNERERETFCHLWSAINKSENIYQIRN